MHSGSRDGVFGDAARAHEIVLRISLAAMRNRGVALTFARRAARRGQSAAARAKSGTAQESFPKRSDERSDA